MDYDIIYSGMSVCLINCFIDIPLMKLNYGFGFFTSNLPEQIILKDGSGNHIAIAEVPNEIIISSVMSVMGDANGYTNELKLVKVF